MPEPNDVAHIDLGEKEVRNHQSNRYLKAVDEASKRVRTGVLATSGQGRPVPYAIVGAPKDVKAGATSRPSPPRSEDQPREARRVAKHAPAIAWDAANVHGNEESGADAALQLLWDLADRTDCAARQIRDNVVTVIVPIQNPDGRWLNYRRNSYGFDMNRDWFARTQPETDGKLELLRSFPRSCSSTTMRWEPRASSSRRTPTRSITRSPTVDPLGQQPLRRADGEAVRRRATPVLQLRHLRHVLHGLWRQRAR